MLIIHFIPSLTVPNKYVKRNIIEDWYRDLIDDLYREDGGL